MEILYVVNKTDPAHQMQVNFTRKRVKNLNLRLCKGGIFALSAPYYVSRKEILLFLQDRHDWMVNALLAQSQRTQYMVVEVSKETAQKTLSPVILKIFPIFSDILKGEMPTIKYRKMKSRWGVCFPTRKSITLNTQLAAMPTAAQEYVVLHEFVHFLHPDHQKGFHAEMKKLMPDYKERQKLLKMPLE